MTITDLTRATTGLGKRRLPRPVTLLRLAIVALAVLFLVRALGSGWTEVTAAMADMARERLDLVLLAIVLETLWVLSLAQVYRSSLVAFGAVAPLRPSIRVSMAAFTLSRVLPGGGAVGALFAAREFVRLGNSAARTLLALISAGWISMLSLAIMVSVGVTLGVTSGSLSPLYLVLPLTVTAGIGLAGLGVWAGLRWDPLRERVVSLLTRLFGRWEKGVDPVELEDALTSGLPRASRLLGVAGWASVSWLLDGAALFTIFAAFGQTIGVDVLSVGYGVANLITALPELTPGWLGVLEGSLSVTYAAHGVPAGLAAAAVLSYRGVSFWMPVVAGAPYALGVLRSQRPAAAEAVAA